MTVTAVAWSNLGEVIAIAGSSKKDTGKAQHLVQFYDAYGQVRVVAPCVIVVV